MMDQTTYQPNIQKHTATVHHSDYDAHLSTPENMPGHSGSHRICGYQSSHFASSCASQQRAAPPSNQSVRSCHQHQSQSFDDSHLYYLKRDYSVRPQYPQSEPQQYNAQNSLQRRRRHSSTSRLKSLQHSNQVQAKHNSNFITSITNNFMSFGAPFLFDWRLFCERGTITYPR